MELCFSCGPHLQLWVWPYCPTPKAPVTSDLPGSLIISLFTKSTTNGMRLYHFAWLFTFTNLHTMRNLSGPPQEFDFANTATHRDRAIKGCRNYSVGDQGSNSGDSRPVVASHLELSVITNIQLWHMCHTVNTSVSGILLTTRWTRTKVQRGCFSGKT